MSAARTYGTLGWSKNSQSGNFKLDVLPHVAIKLKRLFPRVDQHRTGQITIIDTPEIAADLSWFISRYPLEMTPRVRDRLAERTAEQQDYTSSLDEILGGRTLLAHFPEPARPGRPYQQQAADLAYLTGGLLLGDEVGLGKTQSAIMLLRDPTTVPALFVVPTHLPAQWLKELNAVLPHLNGHIITRGTPVIRDHRGRSKAYETHGADVLITSYSKLAGWRDHLAGQIKTVIFDEVQELRRTDSEKYKAAQAIADGADRRMGLSATPIYNYGGEAFAIYEVLKPGTLGTKYEFTREWGASTRSDGGVVVEDPAGLGAYLTDQGLLLRRTRAELGRQLPHEPAEIVMDVPSDSKAVDAVMGDVLHLAEQILAGSREERFTASGQIDMKLRQATGIDKAPYIAEFVRLLLESEQKVALFGWHRAVYEIWLDKLADLMPVMYTGSETPARKAAAVKQFIENPDRRVFICSLRSGAGLDGLQDVANVLVFGELDWSPAMHHQAIGRFARDGQENQVVAYYLVSDQGSDPVIGGVLEAKRQQAEPFMAGDDGALFTAQAEDTQRVKHLARAVLAKAGRIDPTTKEQA